MKKLNDLKNKLKEFAVVQMRPLAVSTELEVLDVSGYKDSELICSSNFAMGNGSNTNIKNIIFGFLLQTYWR